MGLVMTSGAAAAGEAMIQRGRSATDAEGQAEVVFETPYPAIPEVALQPRGTTVDVPVIAKITKLTATGFTVATMRLDGTARMAVNQAFSWIAVGDRG